MFMNLILIKPPIVKRCLDFENLKLQAAFLKFFVGVNQKDKRFFRADHLKFIFNDMHFCYDFLFSFKKNS